MYSAGLMTITPVLASMSVWPSGAARITSCAPTVPPAPATELKITDLVEGTGPAVQPTDSVTVHYVGVGQQSGKEFDSSWSRGEPISFPLNGVIKGWSEGLVGMKVGGRRELVIPGSLAYGPNPPSPDIAPDETLDFVVDLVALN